jgi:alanine-synthesizing transaminase
MQDRPIGRKSRTAGSTKLPSIAPPSPPCHNPPMFSRRTRWVQTPNPLMAAWASRVAAGLPCLDLTESNPTRCGFEYPEQEILQALADPRGLLYQPTPAGLPAARAALAADLTAVAATGSPIHPDRLVLTASTSEAYGWLFKLLCEREDHVLIPRPSYPLFEFLASLEDVVLDPYPLRYEGRWRIDLDALSGMLTPRTRAVVVVHPNNPTGSYLNREEADSLGALCRSHDLALISDEVFHEYPLSHAPDASRASSLAGTTSCLTFSLGGLSKAAGLPQIKVGWIHLGGPDDLVQDARSRLEVIADTYLSVNTPAQWALPRILEQRRGIREQIRQRTRGNLAWLQERASRSPDETWELLKVEGGWSVVLRVPRTRSEEEWCGALVEEDGVLLHPGYFFDFESEAYLVASLLPQEEQFREAMKRVLSAVRRAG